MKVLFAHKLAVILLLSVAMRLGVLLSFPSIFAFDQTGAIHGSDAYDRYARNLLATGVYGKEAPGVPDAHVPPLYGYTLALVYGLVGRGYIQVALFHIALDALSITLLYHIARRLFPQSNGDVIGALAALFYAVYPYLIFQNLTLIDTPLFMTLLHAFVLLMVLLRERLTRDRWTDTLAVMTGIVLGLAILVRPVMLLLAVLASFWFLFRLSFIHSVRRLLPVVIFSLLILLPWFVRNYQLYHVFIAVSLNGGENFYQGNNPYTVPYFRAGYDVQWVPLDDAELSALPDRFGPAANMRRFALGLQYLRNNPDKILELLWVKFLVHWSIDVAPALNPVAGKVPPLDYHGNVISENNSDGLRLSGLPENDPVTAYSQPLFDQIGRTVHRFYYGALFFLALVGVVLTWRRWREIALLWFVQISMTIAYVIFHPSTRYRVPTDPLLFVFSAYGVIALWQAYIAQKNK